MKRSLRESFEFVREQPLAATRELHRIESQRDALVDALKGYMCGHPCSDKAGDQCPTLIEARAAIATATQS